MQTTLSNTKRIKMEISKLKEYKFNPKVQDNSIEISVDNYLIKIMPSIGYPFANVQFKIYICKQLELVCRFYHYLMVKKFNEDIADILIHYTLLNIINSNQYFVQEYNCKKYLIDYGKSTDVMFEYDENMSLSPAKFLNSYINDYIALMQKFSYTYKFISKLPNNMIKK